MKPIEGEAKEVPDASALMCAQRLMDVVPHVMQVLREEMRHHRATNLSIPEFRTLSYIQRHEGTSLTAITEHIGLSKASLSKIVARLEAQNLLRRGAVKTDRRHHTLNLTAHGQRTLDRVELSTLHAVAGRLTHLKQAELVVVVQALALLETPFVL